MTDGDGGFQTTYSFLRRFVVAVLLPINSIKKVTATASLMSVGVDFDLYC